MPSQMHLNYALMIKTDLLPYETYLSKQYR